MVTNLNEINRVLLALRQLSKRRKLISRSLLVEYLRGEVMLGRNPDFELVLGFTGRLGLITITRRGACLAPLGLEILAENEAKLFELQPGQQALLVRKCYLDGALRREMKQFVKKLSADTTTGEVLWSSVDSEPFGALAWLGDHLIQLGVLASEKHILRVTPHYKQTILQFLDEGGDFTEEQLEDYLREKRLLGNIAECFVVEFERNRLAQAGHRLESCCVQRISKHRVNAGYDVNSFDGAEKHLKYDRFIEVKGSGKVSVRFIWTPNEMQKASKLAEKYWIYFVGGIDRKNRLVTREPVMLRNPFVSLKSDNRFRVQTDGSILVEGNVAGLALPHKMKIKP